MPSIGRISNSITDYLFCMCWADGRNRTPALIFTKNRRLNPMMLYLDDRITRKTGAALATATQQLKELTDMCSPAEYDIDMNRIIFTPPLEDEATSSYERSWCVDKFFEVYKEIFDRMRRGKTKIVIISDDGGAFRPGGENIFLKHGIKNHIVLAPKTHHDHSVFDKGILGAAKAARHALLEADFSDNVRSTLSLAHCIDIAKTADVKKYFTRNYLYNEHHDDAAIEKALRLLMKSTSAVWAEHHESCLEAYWSDIRFVGEKALDAAPAAKKPKGATAIKAGVAL